MSQFASHAASAREAHDTVFGGTVAIKRPGESYVTVRATIHQEEIVERPSSMGIVHVATRQVVIRKALIPTGTSTTAVVIIDSQIYSIKTIGVLGSLRNTFYLERTTSQEVSRPAYRGPRQ